MSLSCCALIYHINQTIQCQHPATQGDFCRKHRNKPISKKHRHLEYQWQRFGRISTPLTQKESLLQQQEIEEWYQEGLKLQIDKLFPQLRENLIYIINHTQSQRQDAIINLNTWKQESPQFKIYADYFLKVKGRGTDFPFNPFL